MRPLDPDKIPPELKARPQWVVWRQEEQEGKPTKVPYRPQNPKKKADTTAPDTWGTFGQAVSVAQTNGFHGIGYVFSPQDDYAGVDLDKCRDRETGEIEAWAKKIVGGLASYTEESPSGTGLHILTKGKIPTGGNKKGKVEMYSQGRYFTMTGHHLEGTPATIEPRQVELEALHTEIFGKPQALPKDPSPGPALELSDRELIEKAQAARNGDKFSRLWGGDTTGHASPSEATAALLNRLVFWCGPDPGRIDRLFRQSGLMRGKFDRPQSGSTWGALEIEKAIARATEFYKAPKGKARPPKGETAAGPIVPEIIITRRFLHDKSNEAIKALETANHPPFLFRRSGSLNRISLDEKDHPRIETITDVQLRGILARCAYFLKETEKGLVATSPPMDLVKDILAQGEWKFPALEGIIQAPAMRIDGTVLSEPGYDSQTRLFYVNPPNLFVPAIPENPSQEDLEESLGYLLEIICDFPFVEDSDRANAMGLLITLPLRPTIAGNVPMAVITAPAPGTGKSLLQDTVALIGTGGVAPMAGAPKDDDEMRKFITSRLISGDPLVSFDNLELPLWGPSLSRALTCQEWEDRILGGNTTARLPQRAVWIANGNNLKLRGDLPRRTFPIRLDAGLSRPWERQKFKHGNLIEWVSRYRGDFLAAILTIARAWFVAGKPEPKKALPVMGGFEAWAKIIGGILAFAGVEGFLENLSQFHDEADLEGPEWEGFLSAWAEAIGESAKTCQEVAAILRDNPGFASALPDNLGDVLKDPDKSFERSLGKVLARKEKRPYGENNLALQRGGTHNRAVLWKVAPLSERVGL